MRFLALTTALAAATAAFAQEALRFGVVTVDGDSTVSAGDVRALITLLRSQRPTDHALQTVTLVYNSTLARYKPETVDFLMQGTRTNGDPTPWVVLARNDYGADQKILRKDVRIPDAVGAFGADVPNWGVSPSLPPLASDVV